MLSLIFLALQTAVTPTENYLPPDALPWPKESTVPPVGLVDRLERTLNGRKCIGDISDWDRTYSYRSFTDRKSRFWFDFGTIMGTYRPARVAHGGLRILRANSGGRPDYPADREAIVVYKVHSGKVSVTFCGQMHVPYD